MQQVLDPQVEGLNGLLNSIPLFEWIYQQDRLMGNLVRVLWLIKPLVGVTFSSKLMRILQHCWSPELCLKNLLTRDLPREITPANTIVHFCQCCLVLIVGYAMMNNLVNTKLVQLSFYKHEQVDLEYQLLPLVFTVPFWIYLFYEECEHILIPAYRYLYQKQCRV